MARAAHPAAGRARRTGGLRAVVPLSLGLVLALTGCAGDGSDDGADRPLLTDSPEAATGPTDDSLAKSLEASPEPLITASPDEHSEVGDLVEGFPIDLLPVPSDAVILVTSAVPVGDADVQEVSLNLRTTAEAADLLALYREALTSAGFTEVPPPAGQTDLAAESTFTRSGGDELISIGILDTDGARTVSVGGRVHTGG